MSIHSKARRDARKKKSEKVRQVFQRAVEPHAALRDGEGNLLAAGGRRGREWVIVLEGKVAAGTDSPGMAMAMLRHMASLREAQGLPVQLAYSTTLRSAATVEAQQNGKTLEEFLDVLEEERAERHGPAESLPTPECS